MTENERIDKLIPERSARFVTLKEFPELLKSMHDNGYGTRYLATRFDGSVITFVPMACISSWFVNGWRWCSASSVCRGVSVLITTWESLLRARQPGNVAAE